jgi:uncharacterized protein (TIGR02246 family)
MRKSLLLLAAVCCLPNIARSQTKADSAAVLRTLDSWNQGWADANAVLAVEAYAEDVDWTNAFGDRVVGRDSLRKTLEFIFGLDFVMAGDSGDNEFADLTFLTPDVALLRSKLVRAGQQMRTGNTMPDRHVHHLRVYQRRDGKWQIVSHLISQAHEKR